VSRAARWFLGVLLIVAAAVAGGLAFLFIRYPDVPPAEDVRVIATPERLARGAYLAEHVSGCIDCHSTRDWTKFTAPLTPGTFGRGGDFFGEPESAVQLWAPNITPAALGPWTDGEIIRAVTAGVDRDGRALFPIMPYHKYGRMAREDVEAIVAYIRTLEPIEHTASPRRLGFPLPLVVRTMPQAPAYRPIPPRTDRIAYGEYMVNAAACADCHTPQDQGQPIAGMEFAGGFEFPMPNGFRVRSANITPDADTGIGTWTEDQFVEKFKVFEGAPERVLSDVEQRDNTIMPWTVYAGITEDDLRAMYAYLRSLRPVINRVAIRP
jgi:mono/diheme cytochrome c family protein